MRKHVTVTEIDKRLHIFVLYNKDALEIIRALPGAKWNGNSWSVSSRFRVRVGEAALEIEKIFSDAEALQKAEIDKIDAEASAEPLPRVNGFRSYGAAGRWIIVSPYDSELVEAFKSIKGAKWNGTAWSFPACARSELTGILTKQQEKHGSPNRPMKLRSITDVCRDDALLNELLGVGK